VGQVEQPPTVFVFPLSALQQLVMAQSARANQTLEIDEGSINVVRRAGVAKDLPAHAAVVPSTVHCKRLFAPIANLAQLIGHPKLAQLLLQMNVWVQQVVLIPLTVVLLALLILLLQHRLNLQLLLTLLLSRRCLLLLARPLLLHKLYNFDVIMQRRVSLLRLVRHYRAARRQYIILRSLDKHRKELRGAWITRPREFHEVAYKPSKIAPCAKHRCFSVGLIVPVLACQ
jgi:hypothetical protein